MNNNSIINISFKHLKRKENIIFSIIITILILILLVVLTVLNFGLNLDDMINKKTLLTRTLVVSKENHSEEELDSISNIKHVRTNVSELYYNGWWTYVSEFDFEENKGCIDIQPLFSNDDIKIINGRNINNEYEILVPTKFYPYSLMNDYGESKLYEDRIINGKSLIGKTITVLSDKDEPMKTYLMSDEEYEKEHREWNEKRENITLTIVGTYDSGMYFKEKDTVYADYKLIDELKNCQNMYTLSINNDGSYEENFSYLDGRMIIVDEFKNIEYVKKELERLGFDYSISFDFDKGMILLLTNLPICIGLIIFIITIIRNFIVKKMYKNKKEIGLLEILGFNNKKIMKLYLYENITLILLSIIVSFVLYLVIIFEIIKYFSIFQELYYDSLTFNIPYLYIIILIIVLVIFIIKLIKKLINKLTKYEIVKLIGDNS